jgi:hypothetical protein
MRHADSSQTIPAPAMPCTRVFPSGRRCPFNCAEGMDRCPMHPRAVRAPQPARFEATELDMARGRLAYWTRAVDTASNANARHIARTEAKAWGEIVSRLEATQNAQVST